MEPIPRAFTTARHTQRRAVFKACRDAVKGSPWRTTTGVVFGHRNGWFVAVHEMTGIVEESTKARLVLKPMAIDPILWDMAGQQQLTDQPLSFRYFGALTCPGLILGEFEISEEGGPPQIARRMLQLGAETLDQTATAWTIDRFLQGIHSSVNPKRLFTTRICTLIANDRLEEAFELCSPPLVSGCEMDFLTAGGGFPAMALAYLSARAERRSSCPS